MNEKKLEGVVPAPGEGRPPDRLADLKTDAAALHWAQQQVLGVLNDYRDEEMRSKALLGFGIVMGFAIKGTR